MKQEYNKMIEVDKMTNTQQGGIAGETLKRYIDRIENLEQQKSEISADIREIYARAKGEGFDPKVMKQVIKIKKMDRAEREEQESLLDIYCHALGIQMSLPFDGGA